MYNEKRSVINKQLFTIIVSDVGVEIIEIKTKRYSCNDMLLKVMNNDGENAPIVY